VNPTLHLTLKTSERHIPYVCGADIWLQAAAFVGENFPAYSIAIITDANVQAYQSLRLEAFAAAVPRFATTLVIPAGEASKSRAVKDFLEDELFANKLGRDTLIVAVGGGVVGDLAAYVASTFHRGVPLVHLPTTLLAQVDSCIGGKTGINHASGKNLIGSFYQPEAVFVDIATLETLPDAEFYNGMAEVIKYAATLDHDLWEYLETNEAAIKRREADALTHIITRSAALKIGVVEQDEKESGLRAVLNFGHTTGHAFELLSEYRVPHGFAIASGMRVAMQLSYDIFGYPADDVQRFDALLERYHLKNDYSHRFSRDAVWHTITMDKKSREGSPRFVLMRSPREYVLAHAVERDTLDAALNASVVDDSRAQFCVSVMPQYATDIVAMLAKVDDADMIELRIDMMPVEDVLRVNWAHVRANCEKPLLITCRTREEGGYFVGTDDERVEIFQNAMIAGVEWIDVEAAHITDIAPRLPIGLKTRLVLSHHILKAGSTAQQLQDKLDDMTNTFADVYKLIFTADTVNDTLTATNLIEYAKSRFLNVVIHAMGEFGEPSRIIGAMRGNAWTYVASDEQHITASGQITLSDAQNVYRLQEKTSQTSLYGLLGYPTRQSKGKLLHNALYQHLPNPASLLYLNFPTPEVTAFWSEWRNLLSGLSITIPHKEGIFKLLDELSDEAKQSNVCNTAIPEDGRWKGYNTDVLALEDLIAPHINEFRFGTLVVGTGATTQSAITALQRQGVKTIFVIGRNRARVGTITSKFKVRAVTEADFGSLDIGGIIQTTSVGMMPNTDAMPYGSELFRRGIVVMDVVYNPAITRFLQTAIDEGCTTIAGEEMFVRQAAHQFRLFTGAAVSLEDVRRVWESVGK
jgi:3-dehydroquinate synthase